MKPLIYQYESVAKQTSTFRGYTKTYKDGEVVVHTCPEVRTTRGAAERDAKKLIKKLKSCQQNVSNI